MREIRDAVREIRCVLHVDVGHHHIEPAGLDRLEAVLREEALRGFLMTAFEKTYAVEFRVEAFAIGGADRREKRIHLRARQLVLYPGERMIAALVEGARELPQSRAFRVGGDISWT